MKKVISFLLIVFMFLMVSCNEIKDPSKENIPTQEETSEKTPTQEETLEDSTPSDGFNFDKLNSEISKFKEEKSSSVSKLDRVNENLVRINDIILELEKQLGPLKHQAENAKIFLDLSNKLKELEINIYVCHYNCCDN